MAITLTIQDIPSPPAPPGPTPVSLERNGTGSGNATFTLFPPNFSFPFQPIRPENGELWFMHFMYGAAIGAPPTVTPTPSAVAWTQLHATWQTTGPTGFYMETWFTVKQPGDATSVSWLLTPSPGDPDPSPLDFTALSTRTAQDASPFGIGSHGVDGSPVNITTVVNQGFNSFPLYPAITLTSNGGIIYRAGGTTGSNVGIFPPPGHTNIDPAFPSTYRGVTHHTATLDDQTAGPKGAAPAPTPGANEWIFVSFYIPPAP